MSPPRLVSFGPVVTAALARILCRCAQTTVCKFCVGSTMAIAGVALISFNNAAVFLGERLTQMSLLGGGFIIVGVAIANWRRRR